MSCRCIQPEAIIALAEALEADAKEWRNSENHTPYEESTARASAFENAAYRVRKLLDSK